jgi:carboxyl-terminal processing protease
LPVNQNYVDETNAGELMDIAIKNMLKELDPYTVFFNEQDVLKFKINNTGEYTGIGAMVQRKDGKVYLKEIYKGFEMFTYPEKILREKAHFLDHLSW